ncbi:MAG: DNA replication/repair protein RecF [Clostridia bacterium]|nr:DNA replication/repair protein RecF [Clostridia bacterium]
MYITELKTKGFRNLKPDIFKPSKAINVLLGKNGAGKTSLLEAIYLCSMGASHRQSTMDGLITNGQDFASVSCSYMRNDLRRDISIYLADGQKKIAVNGSPIKKRSELIGRLPAVMFSPDDLNLVKGSPSNRRKYMDKGLAQLSPKYYLALNRYYAALKNRNADLKQGGKALDAWNEQLIAYGVSINNQRLEYVNALNALTAKSHRLISAKEKTMLSLDTDKRLFTNEGYAKMLADAKERDLRFGSTGTGPHKDDIDISIGGKDAKIYASQGQQRTIAIAMKLAELFYLKEAIGESPVLLLDDVMSELDKSRQQKLMEQIEGVQAFITTTHLELSHKGEVFTVSNGTIT